MNIIRITKNLSKTFRFLNAFQSVNDSMGVDGNISVTHSSGNHAAGSSPSAFVATKYTSVANANALPPEANV